jgi:hypothetical protein
MRPATGEETERESRQRAGFEGATEIGEFMAKANQVSIPYLDPSVQHVGISR